MRALRWFLLRGLPALALLTVALLGAFRGAAVIRESKDRHDAAPASGRFLRAAGVEIFVQEAGPAAGTPVVLIHGTGAWSEIWRSTMTELAANGFRAIALDLPPFGYSERPSTPTYGDSAQALRILGVLDALRLTNVVLVGHSFGARPTLEVALVAPSRVTALVLVDAALDLHPPPSTPRHPSAVAKLLAPAAVRNTLVASTLTNPLLTKWLLQLLIANQDAATSDRVQMLQRPFQLEGTTAALGNWFVPFLTSRERSLTTEPARFQSLSMPALIIWGGSDNITPLDKGRELAALLPNAELRILTKSGHIPVIEDPSAFNRALLAFLQRQSWMATSAAQAAR